MQNTVQVTAPNCLFPVGNVSIPQVAEQNGGGRLTRAQNAATIEKRDEEKVAPRRRVSFFRSGKELAKTGMIASTTTMALTGLRILKPLNPLHRFAGIAFLGFTLWHVVQNERVVRRKPPCKST